MSVKTDPRKIEEVLTRGVSEIYPSEDFLRDKLESGEQISLYLGL
ncbi:MAG: tyrosine--tRNA ligase, partial [Candidatus Paceibacteria bacterium]